MQTLTIQFKEETFEVEIEIIKGEQGNWRDSNNTGTPLIPDTFEIRKAELTKDFHTVDLLDFITECGLLEELEDEVEKELNKYR
jgi:hypothetical protein